MKNQTVIAYCKRENNMQKRVYPNQIRLNKMTRQQANNNFKIIQDVAKIAEIAERKGLSWDEIGKYLEQKQDLQKSLFNENT